MRSFRGHNTFLFLILFVSLLFSLCYSYGTLYLNEIYANSDTPNTVKIEGVTIDTDTIYASSIQPPSFETLEVADTIFYSDGWFTYFMQIDKNLNVNNYYTEDILTFDVQGEFTLTVTSEGFESEGSFNVNGGINVLNGAVTVSSTGSLTIESIFKPNGGIVIGTPNGDIVAGNQVFSVDPSTGDFFSAGDLSINVNLYLGSPKAEDIYVIREDSNSGYGGETYISGQSGLTFGGNVYIIPGISQNTPPQNGHVIIGRDAPDNIAVGRLHLTSLFANAGSTTFSGQSSFFGIGGDLYIGGGNSILGVGGDIIIQPGISSSSNQLGEIYLGPSDSQNINIDLYVTRSNVRNTNGSPTFFYGQTSNFGNGGDLYLAAGNSTSGFGGNIYLAPGQSSNIYNYSNYVNFGDLSNQPVVITRVPTDSSVGIAPAGSTYIIGQDSFAGNGGIVEIVAGDAAVDAQDIDANGGNIFLSHGASSLINNPTGHIYIGNTRDPLTVIRGSVYNNGKDTSINGQYSSTGNGGKLDISGGAGIDGGNVYFYGGNSNYLGGDAYIQGGDGFTIGGSINFSPGSTTASSGSDVYIETSFTGSKEVFSGDIYISSGISSSGGYGFVNIGSGNTYEIDFYTTSGFVIQNSQLNIFRNDASNPTNQVKFSSDPEALITVDGNVILKSQRGPVSVYTDISPDNSQNIAYLQDSILTLLNALGPCGHGLITFGEEVGLPINDCILPYNLSN